MVECRLLTRQPQSVSEHLAFLDEVCAKVLGAVETKRRIDNDRFIAVHCGEMEDSAASCYEGAELAKLLRGIPWEQAREIASLLGGKLGDMVQEVVALLDRDLTVDSVRELHNQFAPALRRLRSESGFDYATPLPELIESLLSRPDNVVLSLQELVFLESQLETGVSFQPKLCCVCCEPLSHQDRHAGLCQCSSHGSADSRLTDAFSAEARAKLDKLVAIREYNRKLEQRQLLKDVDDGTLPTGFVTLQQAAAICNRSKRTLERLCKKSGFPRPKVLGGGGKPNEYAWSELRPFLEKEYKRELPETFPADRLRPAG